MSDYKINRNKKIYFSEIIIVLFVFLGVYKVGHISVAYIITLLYTLYLLYKNKYIIIHKWLLYFVFYVVINQLILIILGRDFISVEFILKNLIMTLVSVFVVFVLSNSTTEDRLYKVYSFFGVITIIGLFYHAIQVYILGNLVYPIVPFSVLVDKSLHVFHAGINRPISMFLEPQHYSSFIIPLLYFTLKKHKLLFSILITISILLSTSIQGIIMATSIWLFFFVIKYKDVKIKVIAIVLFVIVATFFITSEISEFTVNKATNIHIGSDVRISRGFGIFLEMKPWDKLVGIGSASNNSYLTQNVKNSSWNNSEDFMTSYSGVLVQYGIICSIIFNILLLKIYKISKRENFGFFILIIIATFGQTILFNSWFILYFSIILNISNKNNKEYFILRL